jgi:alkylhydroperoxidase family enzyme
MDRTARPAPRLAPLPPDATLGKEFAAYEKSLGFVPNSVLIMQRRPKLVRALAELAAAVWDPESTVDRGFKRLLAHFASRAAGCQYCMAHTAGGALRLGVTEAKLAALWDYRTSPLYSEAERLALDFALAAAAVPNEVSDELFGAMREHWTEDQMVEIVGVISLFGFLNRWNDTMATPLEAEPVEVGERFLAKGGWNHAKHVRATGTP